MKLRFVGWTSTLFMAILLSPSGLIQSRAEERKTAFALSTSRGHFSLSGATGIGVGSVQKPYWQLAPHLEYFLIDRLSIGVAFSSKVGLSAGAVRLGTGPSLTYHFLQYNRLSLYGRSGYLFERSTTSISNSLNLSVGANYYLLPTFGLGPQIMGSFDPKPTISGNFGVFFHF